VASAASGGAMRVLPQWARSAATGIFSQSNVSTSPGQLAQQALVGKFAGQYRPDLSAGRVSVPVEKQKIQA
jgi:hypothetical protein